MTRRKAELKAKGYRSVAREDEVADDQPHLLQWDERQLVLYRRDGRYFATEGVCPHAAGPLGSGDLEGFEIVCPLHGWSFDIRSGKCTNIEGMHIETFALEVVEGEVFLKLDA